MSKENWIWMGHAGHFICSKWCRFHLNTYVNGYIVSTIGEYWPESNVRRSLAEMHNTFCDDPGKIIDLSLKGDSFDNDYLLKKGFEAVSLDFIYETMVFKSYEKENETCCPYSPSDWDELECDRYMTSKEAHDGHYALCEKYDNNV